MLAAGVACVVLLLAFAAPATAAPAQLTASDRVFADLADDDQLRERDRASLHAASATPTFDQYRGNDPDVLATCPQQLAACDVRTDDAGAASGVAAGGRAGGATPGWPLLAVGALLLALLAAIACVSDATAHRIRRVAVLAPTLVIASWAALVVVGTRPIRSLDGAFASQWALEALQLVALGLVVVASFGARRDRRRAVLRAVAPLVSIPMLLLGAFLAFAWWSRSWSADVDNANVTFGAMLGGASATAALAVLAARRRDAAPVALGVLALAAGPASLAAGLLLPRIAGRMAGVPGDPNLLGMTFAAAACIALAAIATRAFGEHVAARPVAFAVLASALVGIGATQSRGALASLLVGTAIACALVRGRRVVLLGAGTLALATCMVVLVGFVTTGQGSALERSGAGDATSGRLDTWSNAARQAADNPVAGVGLGGFVASIERHRTAGDRSLVQAAHNTPLQVAAELGSIGLLLGAGTIVAFAGVLLRRARRGDPLAIAWCAGAASCAAGSLLLTTYAEPLAWALLAIGAAIAAGRPELRTSAVVDDDGDARLTPVLQLGVRRRADAPIDHADRRDAA